MNASGSFSSKFNYQEPLFAGVQYAISSYPLGGTENEAVANQTASNGGKLHYEHHTYLSEQLGTQDLNFDDVRRTINSIVITTVTCFAISPESVRLTMVERQFNGHRDPAPHHLPVYTRPDLTRPTLRQRRINLLYGFVVGRAAMRSFLFLKTQNVTFFAPRNPRPYDEGAFDQYTPPENTPPLPLHTPPQPVPTSIRCLRLEQSDDTFSALAENLSRLSVTLYASRKLGWIGDDV